MSLQKSFAQLSVQMHICIFLKKEHTTFIRVSKGSTREHPSFNLLNPCHLQIISSHLSLETESNSFEWLNPNWFFWHLREDYGWIVGNGHLSLLFCRILKSGESWISLPCRNHLTCKGGAPRTRHSRTTTWPSDAAMFCSSWNSKTTLTIILWCVLIQFHSKE